MDIVYRVSVLIKRSRFWKLILLPSSGERTKPSKLSVKKFKLPIYYVKLDKSETIFPRLKSSILNLRLARPVCPTEQGFDDDVLNFGPV